MIWPQISPDVSPAVYYLCVGLAVLITGMSKSGFGGGAGIVAMPLMGAVMPPQHMLGIMLPVLIAADVLSNLHYLREYDWRLLKPLLAGALVGVIGGSIAFFFMQQADSRWLALLIGSICLLFVGVQAIALAGRRVPTLPSHPASSVGIGMLAGAVSTLSHSAGPLITLYLLQEKLDKRVLVGTQLLFFLLINISKVPTYALQGTINGATLLDSIWFIPLLPIGTLSGAWLNRHLSPKPFVVILYAAAAVTAAYMIYRAVV